MSGMYSLVLIYHFLNAPAMIVVPQAYLTETACTAAGDAFTKGTVARFYRCIPAGVQ